MTLNDCIELAVDVLLAKHMDKIKSGLADPVIDVKAFRDTRRRELKADPARVVEILKVGPGPGREGAVSGDAIPRGTHEAALEPIVFVGAAPFAVGKTEPRLAELVARLLSMLRAARLSSADLKRVVGELWVHLQLDRIEAKIAEDPERARANVRASIARARPINEAPIVGSDNVSSVAPPASDNAASVPQSTPRDDRSGPITETPAPSPDELASSAEEDAKAWEEIALSFDRVIMSTALELNLSKSLVETVAERVWRASREEGRFGRVTLLLDRALARAELVRKTSDTLAGEPLDFFARRPSDAIEVARALVEAWKFVDAIVRVDVPELVAEVKRLRGWS